LVAITTISPDCALQARARNRLYVANSPLRQDTVGIAGFRRFDDGLNDPVRREVQDNSKSTHAERNRRDRQ
jgi:hypothetical protein